VSFTDNQAGYTSATPQFSTYLDLNLDGKQYLQYPAQKTDQDAVLQLLLDTACTWVSEYLGRPIGPTKFQRRFDGWTSWQGSYILLPHYPVLEIVEIIEWWGTSGPHVLLEQTPAAQWGPGVKAGTQSWTYQLEPLSGKVIRTFPGLIQRPFFPGSRNIEIEWVAGYSPIPSTVKFATLELFAHLYRNTQEDPRMAAQVQPYGKDSDNNALWPAIPNRVVAMLEPYMQQGMG
jgi:hypothetical protein